MVEGGGVPATQARNRSSSLKARTQQAPPHSSRPLRTPPRQPLDSPATVRDLQLCREPGGPQSVWSSGDNQRAVQPGPVCFSAPARRSSAHRGQADTLSREGAEPARQPLTLSGVSEGGGPGSAPGEERSHYQLFLSEGKKVNQMAQHASPARKLSMDALCWQNCHVTGQRTSACGQWCGCHAGANGASRAPGQGCPETP